MIDKASVRTCIKLQRGNQLLDVRAISLTDIPRLSKSSLQLTLLR